jgi:urea transport system permease protein
MTPEKSLEAVVWVAVGGRGTLLGPVIGAVGVNALKSWATRAIPDLWILLMGGLFILAVLFLPGGIVSIPGKLLGWWKRLHQSPALEPPTPADPVPAPKAQG